MVTDLSTRFHVVDTTLRDGLQNPEMPEHGKFSLTIPERLEIFTALVKYGVRYVEVFSPLVNATEKESLSAILDCRNKLSKEFGHTFILAHVRCEERDVQAAIDAGVDGLNIYIPTSAVCIKTKNFGSPWNPNKHVLRASAPQTNARVISP